MTKKLSLNSLFISHGAPTTPLEGMSAQKFLKVLVSTFNKLKAVLCILLTPHLYPVHSCLCLLHLEQQVKELKAW